MLNSPEGVLKHKDITNASLTIVGEHVLFMPVFPMIDIMVMLCAY